MSYLKELQDHYKAVKARLRANAIREVKALPPPMPVLPKQGQPSEAPKAGLAPEGADAKLVTEALRQSNPEWVGGNNAQAIRIAQEMMTSPRLPPLPGLVLNEIGAVRWMRVLHAVAKHHNVEACEILSTSRKKHVTQARFEVFYRLRVDLQLSYTKIAGLMKKDHTTVLHGVNKMRAMLLDATPEAADYGSLAIKHPVASETHTTSLLG